MRVHSECLTGDVLGSRRCDCGPQLHESVDRIEAAGGYLLYLRQEGRGIGLYAKLDAYALQDDGLDTYDANLALGYAEDERDYTAAAQMLPALGVDRLALLSNNPDKAAQLAAHGLEVVERVPTAVHLTASNRRYLAAKADRGSHALELGACSPVVETPARLRPPRPPGRITRMSDDPRPVHTWLTDMDGVLVHEEEPIPGGPEFIEALKTSGLRFLVLTNNSIYTPRDLRARLLRQRHRRARGRDLDLGAGDRAVPGRPAAARFGVRRGRGGADQRAARHRLRDDRPQPRLRRARRDPHLLLRVDHPGDPAHRGRRPVHRHQPGRRPGPSPAGSLPATGSVAALISTATGRSPYFIGKPNPLMMRSALNRLEAHSETTVMVGDRMDTDIISGLEAGLRTVLVTTGSTRPEDIERFPYRPTRVVDSIADLVELVQSPDSTGRASE